MPLLSIFAGGLASLAGPTGLASLALHAGCRHGPASTVPVEAAVVLRAGAGHDLRVRVELARSDPERTRGLMYRQKLEPGWGMLFLFSTPGPLKFWMHNTYIPLDMLFISAQKRVVYIEENAEPLTDVPRGPDVDTQYVLEVPGGWARASGIAQGSEVRFEGVAE
jgi:uncharacterized membrane protein (UPF0127 family)